MSKGYIIGGGGSTKMFAVIGVTYPSGSTCTCTNGTKTLKAKGTSGTAIFNVPSTGTWTVTATNGDKTASKSVSITAEGQTVSVVLLYQQYLFSETDGNVGGWISDGNFTIASNYMTVDDAYASWAHCPKVDLSNFSTLYIDSQKTSGGALDSAYIAPSTTTTISTEGLNFGTSTTRETQSLDISAYTGQYYIAIYGSWTTRKIYNIWLE